MINMVKVREGQVIDYGDYLVIAIKEIERNACTGCYFNKLFNTSCFKLIKNCPSNKLIFKEINYNMIVKCIKELPTKHITFKLNEEYKAQKINENWYCVDSVGIKVEDFNKHFQLEKGGL